MYFGLYNFPETFQWIMNSTFQELLHEEVLANYINNFVIQARNIKKLEERTV